MTGNIRAKMEFHPVLAISPRLFFEPLMGISSLLAMKNQTVVCRSPAAAPDADEGRDDEHNDASDEKKKEEKPVSIHYTYRPGKHTSGTPPAGPEKG